LLLVAWFRPQTGPAPATNTLSREMVFDTLSPTAQEVWPHHLFMAARPQPGQWVALASQGTQLWRLEIASLEAGGLGISGAWAEYTDTLARFFRSGELAGTGRWLQVGQELAVTLDFHAIQDGSEWSTPLLLRRSAEPLLLPEFARRLERSGYVQPLLYNELLPRGAGWVEAVESEFLNAASPRVQVPFLRGSSNVLLVDGKLDENTWRTPALGGIEGHGATAGVSPGTLMVRYDEGNLYVGLHLTQTPERPRLLFTLLTQFDIPASSSARWMVQFEKDTISARRWVRHGQETPWDCQWRIAAGSLPGEAPGAAWEAEALIPIANLGNVVPPRPGQRWRLNCAAGGPSGGSVAGAAYWGSEDIEAIEEGILLVFEGA
ncbi:MAG: hypothetical protein HYV26_22730, partial [Candidatus Hydrogenedentes bacterium]|nr:hypothetical protein [Candidatus Hydrogenedentota bacterium]